MTVKATARITDNWLPFPDSILEASGWKEGDAIEVEVVDTDEGPVLMLTKLADNTRVSVRKLKNEAAYVMPPKGNG